VQLRQASTLHADLAKRLDELERTTERLALSHDTFSRNTRIHLKQLFDALRALMTPPDPPGAPLAFAPPFNRNRSGRSIRAVYLLNMAVYRRCISSGVTVSR
jgi:hypothetical protein